MESMLTHRLSFHGNVLAHLVQCFFVRITHHVLRMIENGRHSYLVITKVSKKEQWLFRFLCVLSSTRLSRQLKLNLFRFQYRLLTIMTTFFEIALYKDSKNTPCTLIFPSHCSNFPILSILSGVAGTLIKKKFHPCWIFRRNYYIILQSYLQKSQVT